MLRSIYPSDEARYSALAAFRHQTAPDRNQTRSPLEELSECLDHNDLKTSSGNAPPKRSRTPLQKPWVWFYDIYLPLAFFGGTVAMFAVGVPRITQRHTSTGYTGEPFPEGICDHSGNFGLGLNAPPFWSPSQTFLITVSFGSFTFSMAKFIDVVWDVVLTFYRLFYA